LRSPVARSVGAAISQVRPAGGAAQYAYYTGIDWAGMELFVAEQSFAGVFPTHDGQACISVSTPSADAQAVRRRSGSREEAFGELLGRSAPQLAGRLRHARRTSPVQGMLRQPNQVRQAFGPGWALVGDAGYYRDAITAHGISDAFRDAEFLAIALDQALRACAEEGTALARCQQHRDQALREIFEITCRLAAYPAVPAFTGLQNNSAPPSTPRQRHWPSGRSRASACRRPPDLPLQPGKEATPRNPRTDHTSAQPPQATHVQGDIQR
jgi:flavin-dependent dehydrogenase